MSLLEQREYIKQRNKTQKNKFEETLVEYLKIRSLWNKEKPFISNKRNWLNMEGNYFFGIKSIKTLNSYKDYNHMTIYLKRRINFYKEENNIKLIKEFIEKISKTEMLIDRFLHILQSIMMPLWPLKIRNTPRRYRAVWEIVYGSS